MQVYPETNGLSAMFRRHTHRQRAVLDAAGLAFSHA